MMPPAPLVLRRALRAAAYALLAALGVACGETPRATPAPATIRIASSSTLSLLLDEMGDVYRADHPWMTLQLETLDTSAALDRLDGGEVDLAFVSWLPDDSRRWSSALAYDAVAVVVNPANPVTGLSLAQLRDIYQGRVADWSPLGGPNQALVVVSRETGSGTRAAFENAVMEGRPVTLAALVQPDSGAVVEYVARTPGAIGYVSRGRVTDAVKPIAVEGIAPEPSGASGPGYPIRRVLYVAAQREPSGAARELVTWMFSDAGQGLIAQQGFGRIK